MVAEGHGRLFAAGLADGPLPEHYEPMESPMAQPDEQPAEQPGAGPARQVDKSGVYYIATTCRVSEHWQAGAMTRNLPWLVELVPDMFVEISEELAKKKDIANGDFVTITSKRGSIQARALVTSRIKPLRSWWENGGTDCNPLALRFRRPGHGRQRQCPDRCGRGCQYPHS